MYTIFINESVIYLSENPREDTATVNFNYGNSNLRSIITEVVQGIITSVCIHGADLPQLWSDFKQEFKVVEAAGGLVFNEKKETLWILRNGVWDLPKGKLEKNEDFEHAALREVAEECGVTNLKLVCPMEKTYHVYFHKGKSVLKITYWYKMFANSKQKLKPQLEENITEVIWMDNVKIQEALNNTYDNIKLLCKFAAL